MLDSVPSSGYGQLQFAPWFGLSHKKWEELWMWKKMSYKYVMDQDGGRSFTFKDGQHVVCLGEI